MIAPQILAETQFTTTVALGACMIILALASPWIVALVIYFKKKRLEHEQIMAAIEKGTPISEIMPPKPQPAGPAWIKYAAIGVALLIIGIGAFLTGGPRRDPEVLIAFTVIGVGAGFLTRGILHRKYYIQERTDEEEVKKPKK